MNIKIHTSLVLATCTLTGLVLGGLLVQRSRQVDVDLGEVEVTSVSLRNSDLLGTSIGQWLIANDLVLDGGPGQSYMVGTSTNQAKQLGILIGEIAASPLAEGQAAGFHALRDLIDALQLLVFEARDCTGDDRAALLEEIRRRARPLSDQLLAQFQELDQKLELRAAHRREDLVAQKSFVVVLSWLAGVVYFGIIWLCWLWTVHKVAAPIASLSEAAARADHEEREFVLPQTGPDEVRQLTHNISNFVAKLQDAKAGTEEEVRQRTQELVKANQAKGDFLATMSHELRTPLNGIINMNELMLETQLDQDQSDFARTAKSAAEALLALINDILDFSKIEARKLQLETVEFDLREVVDSAVEILAGVAESKALELQAVIAQEVPARIKGDPTRLRQVLINLLNNALKFTAEGSVMARVRVIDETGAETKLMLEVSDTGIGIPEDRKASLFRAFEQVDSSTTRKFGGTGLGLAICRELVTLMGGEIDVDSAEGVGSTFWFTASFGKVAVEPAETIDIGDRGVAVVTTRSLLADRVAQQLGYLGLPADRVAVVERLGDLALAGREWLVLIDPYRRDGAAFAEVDAARACPTVDGSRIAVLDHWLRHWSKEMGAPIGAVVKVTDPTAVDALRAWLEGSTVARQFEVRGDKVQVTKPAVAAPVTAARSVEVGLGTVRHRVLVAEDTEINQRVIRSMLERGGYEVRVVENGQLAVDTMAREQFDIVVMDCQMPVMDGLEATRRIRAMELERTASSAMPEHVPIIALTANAQMNFDKECLAAGMDRFLSKPCRKQPLLDAMQECLSGRRAAEGPAVPPPRVLVADDDAINRKVAQSILGRAGYQLVMVENGQEAVDRVRSEAFDIVLMDCQMPVLGGLDASRAIRDLETSGGLAQGMPRRLPIVALTGNVQESDRADAAAAGMDEFVTKPFRPKDLLEVVTRFAGPGRKA